MQHIIIGCPFSWQVWHDVLAWVRATTPSPSGDEDFLPWCSATIRRSPTSHRKGLATLAVLTAWSIWRYHNSYVFDGENPSPSRLFSSIQEEAHAWARAGAHGLGALIA